ncbi:MAG: prepilin-type N-terminal cleavage/methylation domain-containing protein [Patescibacteria group bacterium]
MNISIRHQKGFTLAELLVVMAIIGLMSTLVLVNFQSGRRATDLKGASTRLLQDIRLAQSYTIAGNSFNYCQPGSANPYILCQLYTECGGSPPNPLACKNTTPTNGYGIYIGNQDTYQIFGDTKPDGILETSVDYQVINQDNTLKNIYILGYRVYSTVTPSQAVRVNEEVDTHPVSVTFSPPEGTARLYVDGLLNSDYTNLDIVLKSSHIADFCRRVSINILSGQVSESQGSCTP